MKEMAMKQNEGIPYFSLSFQRYFIAACYTLKHLGGAEDSWNSQETQHSEAHEAGGSSLKKHKQHTFSGRNETLQWSFPQIVQEAPGMQLLLLIIVWDFQ